MTKKVLAAGASRAARPIRQEGLTDKIVAQWHGEMPSIDPALLTISAMVTRLSILNDGFLARISRELGIGIAGLRLLYALRRVGPPYRRRPTELYQLLAVTSGAVSYTIGLLERRGLIEIVEDPQDGRSRFVRLTEEGLRLTTEAATRGAALMAGAADALTPEEQRAAIGSLGRLARSWERLADARQPPDHTAAA